MAYFRKLPSGTWRAEVDLMGVRDSTTGPTKREVQEWATQVEADIRAGKRGRLPRKTLAEAVERYVDEVAVMYANARAERLAWARWLQQMGPLAQRPISELTTDDLARWRDSRLQTITAGSASREINRIRAMFTIARDEWKWISVSPFDGLRRPGDNPPRERRVKPLEVRAIARHLGYVTGRVETASQQVALAFLIALRTGMRLNEITRLHDEIVDLERRVIRVKHKMQYLTLRTRDIPLTHQAVRLLKSAPGRGKGLYISPSAGSISTQFSIACDRLGISGLQFRDSRAEALTRLSKRVDVLTLARISGHKDINILEQHYYRETAEDIARRL